MQLPTLFRNHDLFDVSSLQKEVNRLFNSFWGGGTPARTTGAAVEAWLPAIDLKETKENYLLKLELPGISPEQIQLQCNGNELSIRGETRREEEKGDGTWHRSELRQGVFFRSLTLPGIDPDKVKASYKNGILEVLVGKKEEQKGRTVKVEVSR